MSAGLGLLRLSPKDFWSMTPREIAAAMRAVLPRRKTRPERADLEAMMKRFPDDGG